MAAQLATVLKVPEGKGWDEWTKLHRKLGEVAAAARDVPITAVQALLEVAQDVSSSQAFMRNLRGSVSQANLKYLVFLVAAELNMTPLCDSEPVHMVDGDGKFCEGNVRDIINSSAELSAPNAPYTVISIVGAQSSGKSYLLNCLFGTKFPVMDATLGWCQSTRGIMMSRCIGPSLLLLDFEGFDGRDRGKDELLGKQATLFALTVSDIMMVNIHMHDIDRAAGDFVDLFRSIFQEQTKLPRGNITKVLVVIRRYDEQTPLVFFKRKVLETIEQIWKSGNPGYVKFEDYIEVDIIALPGKREPEFPRKVTELRKLFSNNRNCKIPASSFSSSSRISWDTIKQNLELEARKKREEDAALKAMPTHLASILRVQGQKGRDEWSQIHRELAKVAALARDDPRTAGQTLLKLAKDASSTQDLMRTLEGRVSKANPTLLKDLVLLVAEALNMTPLCDSETVRMVNEDHVFCEGNVDRIIKSSVELSSPNAPYAVISIIGGQSSGKSYLLNSLFGTKFREMEHGHGRSIGIMMSRCIGPPLLLLDFEGFRTGIKGQDTTFQKQATLFALTVSDLVIVHLSLFDIEKVEGYATLLFRIMLEERTKLPQGLTQMLVVVRYYDIEPQFETLRSNVEKFLEKIWEHVAEHVKFKDYIKIYIVGLPDKNSSEYPRKVTSLRKLFSNIGSAKVPCSGFLCRSSILWDTILQNKKLDIHQFYPGESIFPVKSNITLRLSSANEPSCMTFREIRRATNGFSDDRLIGTGGFGNVYKGVFDNGEVIAVKKLHNIPGVVQEQFKNELLNLRKVQHPNIIRLVGYCSEAYQIIDSCEGKEFLVDREQRALCLEYMEGGTLQKILSDELLDWEASYKIIKGICQGLKHLHKGSKDPIYHLDLKPANILLDKDQVPKIGDFGISTLLASTGTFITPTNLGTLGYMPPEYTLGQQVSSKFDVFSLGVIILEIIAGPEGHYNYKCVCASPQEFIDHVTESWSKRVQSKTMSTEDLLDCFKKKKKIY